MAIIQVSNDGPLIVETNYWDSALAKRGLVWCSVNAGAIRVLLPPAAVSAIDDMSPAKHCVLSRGPWPDEKCAEGLEIMWDDESDSPFALHLTPESFDMLPGQPEPGREWICSVWTSLKGKIVKQLEHPCHWRRVARIPWMKSWKQ